MIVYPDGSPLKKKVISGRTHYIYHKIIDTMINLSIIDDSHNQLFLTGIYIHFEAEL